MSRVSSSVGSIVCKLSALLVIAIAGTAASQAASPARIAVLTPGAPPVLRVTSMDVLSKTIGFSAAAGDPASKDLTALGKKDGFDAAERFSAQLVSALHAAGRDVAAIQVSRSNSKGPRPLERDELPQDSDGRMMLDVTLLYVAVAAITEFNQYKPAVGLSYRLLDEKGRIAQGSRSLAYRESSVKGTPGWFAKPGSFDGSLTFGPVKYVEFNNDPACGFKTFNKIKESSAQLWTCFDDAFSRMADQVVAGLP
jgi:hypothetical protein